MTASRWAQSNSQACTPRIATPHTCYSTWRAVNCKIAVCQGSSHLMQHNCSKCTARVQVRGGHWTGSLMGIIKGVQEPGGVAGSGWLAWWRDGSPGVMCGGSHFAPCQCRANCGKRRHLATVKIATGKPISQPFIACQPSKVPALAPYKHLACRRRRVRTSRRCRCTASHSQYGSSKGRA